MVICRTKFGSAAKHAEIELKAVAERKQFEHALGESVMPRQWHTKPRIRQTPVVSLAKTQSQHSACGAALY